MELESESDRSRLVFSAPFRRLQQKAQVFSLEENAAVRSRLTHSLEVAQVGRFLTEKIINGLIDADQLRHDQARAFLNFVETACLMHDIGNPPFGHFGEHAISQWFKRHGLITICESLNIADLEKDKIKKESVEKILADFYEFDGNCQGLRIASLLQWNDDQFGLNLTFTTYYAYLKYIRAPIFDKSTFTPKSKHHKKAGYFSSEEELISNIYANFGIHPSNPKRFPLTYIMEAADDMAYCLSDLEDALEKKLVQFELVFRDINSLWQAQADNFGRNSEYIAIESILQDACEKKNFTTLKTRLLNYITDQAVDTYVTKHQSILNGEIDSIIDECTPKGRVLELIKTYCRVNVYQQESVQRIELTGLSAIKGLLDHFLILLQAPRRRFKSAINNEDKDELGNSVVIEKKLLSLFPPKHLKAYCYTEKNATDLGEWHARAHLITDFISGMTDDFALGTYQMLSGIRY